MAVYNCGSSADQGLILSILPDRDIFPVFSFMEADVIFPIVWSWTALISISAFMPESFLSINISAFSSPCCRASIAVYSMKLLGTASR